MWERDWLARTGRRPVADGRIGDGRCARGSAGRRDSRGGGIFALAAPTIQCGQIYSSQRNALISPGVAMTHPSLCTSISSVIVDKPCIPSQHFCTKAPDLRCTYPPLDLACCSHG